MNLKKAHYFSGLAITFFVALHLFNHSTGILGAEQHIKVMSRLRPYYRNPIAETVLLAAIAIQIYSGLKLFAARRKTVRSGFEKLHIYSGLYLALFFVIHLGAIFAGRLLLRLDTNFFFGVAGLNTFPLNIFFIPYYGLAIVAFFGHIAAIHNERMKRTVLFLHPRKQSALILLLGICFTLFLLYALTNRLQGYRVPAEYHILTGK
ncbi:MAG: hypothetical protein JNM68_09545 [Dinghuibacter sp.]|nr:hypothetical protein [Dinghuibacter sp.]